ncbi:uncharacterized protein LOC135388190 [Ornithodoros turicata]
MRPVLFLLLALCFAVGWATSSNQGAHGLARVMRPLWWPPGMARRQVRAGQPNAKQGKESPGEKPVHSAGEQSAVRAPRGAPQYDVPQIECPSAEDGMERFACPSPDRMGRYRCIDDHVLCDGFIDCPQGEDEDRMSCMFYKTTKAHLDVLADALLRWARGRY